MWKEQYKIGVTNIDEQHRALFSRVAGFIQAVRGAGQWEDKIDKVKDTLEFMKAYVIFHFDDEEEYQQEIGYPGYVEHKQAHEKFKGAIAEYEKRFEQEGYHEELVQEFGGKLMTWLIMHVAAMDQKIGEYVNNQSK